jgi:hypothetical protein
VDVILGLLKPLNGDIKIDGISITVKSEKGPLAAQSWEG